MREVGRDVERKAVQRHPAAHAHPDRADLGLSALCIVGPDANPPLDRARLDPQRGARVDNPALERVIIGAYVASAPRQVELGITDALARTMTGIASAPDRKSPRLTSSH